MLVKINLKDGEEPIHGSSWDIDEPSGMIILRGKTPAPDEKVYEYNVPIDNIVYIQELEE